MAKSNSKIKAAIMKGVVTGGAAIGVAKLNDMAATAAKPIDPLLRGIGGMLLGTVILPSVLKGKQAQMGENIGSAVVSVSSLVLANATMFKNDKIGISGVSGIGAIPYPEYVHVS